MSGEELLLLVVPRNRKHPRNCTNERVLIRLDLDLFLPEHLDSGVNEERAKDVDDPVKAINERCADKDHRQSHYQCAHHAPEEDAVLKLRRDFEVREDQQEHEQVIDRERQLDQVTGDKLEATLGSEIAEDDTGEDH